MRATLLAHPDATEVVLLVDSAEHFRGTLTTDADVQASVENLFFNQADNADIVDFAVTGRCS